MELFLVLVVLVPAAIGLIVRRWWALGVVFGLWLGLMLFAAAEWGLSSDDVPAEGLVLASVVTVLLPAELVAALAVALGRRGARSDR